jgi:hypothetical protein
MKARLVQWWDKRTYSQVIALALAIGFSFALILRQLVTPLIAFKIVCVCVFCILVIHCVQKIREGK